MINIDKNTTIVVIERGIDSLDPAQSTEVNETVSQEGYITGILVDLEKIYLSFLKSDPIAIGSPRRRFINEIVIKNTEGMPRNIQKILDRHLDITEEVEYMRNNCLKALKDRENKNVTN